MPMIDVIVPVLERPGNAQPLVDSLTASGASAKITFVCSYEDDAQIEACKATEAEILFLARDPGPGDFARKINRGFAHTEGEFVFMGADDITFAPGWDTHALKMMRGRIGVVATNDKANRQVMRGEFGTHCLIRRSYIDEHGGTFDQDPGVVLYEGYDHNFVDRELCDVARRRRAFAFARESIVAHRHPLWRTASWDPTYRKALARFSEDQRLYMARASMWRTRKPNMVSR
jgi:hypothetical protein